MRSVWRLTWIGGEQAGEVSRGDPQMSVCWSGRSHWSLPVKLLGIGLEGN